MSVRSRETGKLKHGGTVDDGNPAPPGMYYKTLVNNAINYHINW